MKALILTTMLWSSLAPAHGGERERGMQLYREGRYAEAQAAFEAAAEADPEAADLQWNLALAAWRAGDLATAEVAAEKYAAMSEDARPELHRGLLGAVRFAEAEQFEARADALIAAGGGGAPVATGPADEPPPDPLPLYEKALQKALQARNHFVRGVRAKATPELVRNTERAVRKIDELKKRIEDLLQQQQQAQDGEPQEGEPQEAENEDAQKQPGDPQQPQQGEGEGEEQAEQPPQQAPPSEAPEGAAPETPEPQPESQPESQPGEPSQAEPPQGEPSQPQPGDPGESQERPEAAQPNPQQPSEEQANRSGAPDGSAPESPEPVPDAGSEQSPAGVDEPRNDAPGEAPAGRMLTPEETQRLLERLRRLDEQLEQAKSRMRGGRPRVERDW